MKYNLKISKIIILFIWITYIIYRILPWQPVDYGLNEIYSIIFLTCVSIAVYIGCNSVPIYKDFSSKKYDNDKYLFSERTVTAIQTIIIIITFCYLGDLFARGLGGFTLSLGENYKKMLDSTGKTMEISGWGQLYALLSPLRYIILSYGAYYFIDLTKVNKYLYIGVIVSSICYSIFGLGTQKGVGDIVIIIIITFWIKAVNFDKIKEFRKSVVIILVLFGSFFIYMSASRSEALGNGGRKSNRYYNYNPDNLVCKVFGDDLGGGIIGLGSYVSNGYPGLNYCLQMDFQWTHGYGNTRAGNDYLVRYCGLESQFEKTYPMRMQKEVGWPGLMFWPTAYSWWASDLTWMGVVLLMLVFSRFICILFKEAYYYSNPLSICILPYFSIGIIYLAANNQLMQSTANFISTVVLLVIWLIYHKKYNYD